MATRTFVTNDYARKGQIKDLQVTTNTIVQSINQINDKVVDVQEKVDKTIEVTHKSQESTQHHEELMEGLGEAFSTMGKTLLEIKQKDHIPDKPIPHSFILPNPPVSIISPIYKPSEMTIEKKFPHHFPKTQDEPKSSKNNLSLVSIQKTSFEDLPHHLSRPPAPDLLGKGKIPESQTFAEDWFPEWNINNLSVGQIRQMLDRMYVSYKVMCMKGKSEVEACKSIIQCFTGTLSKWWEVISSPIMITKMEANFFRDEQGDIVYHINGTPHNNMIGSLTTLI
jgi:hypothetical protein